MNFEDLCNSGLTLGSDHSERPKHRKNPQVSLTLALSLEPTSTQVDVESTSVVLERQLSSISVVSEVGRGVVDGDQDEDESGGRKKLKLNRYQSRILQDSFNDHNTLNLKQKQALARRLSLRPRQVEVWYQNRRARNKLKQTEMDCEMMKKCYETLQDENRRLENEVQHLRATKGKGVMMMPQFDMQLPPPNLNICPFCERITGPVSGQITL